MDLPPEHFLCPISRELMSEPVTIITGVTYDRKNIERWFFSYKKKTCPATMQTLTDFNLTPNHTLRRLILSCHHNSGDGDDGLAELVAAVESSPFKVASLKKLRSAITSSPEAAATASPRLVGVLVGTLVQVLSSDGADFSAFRAAEEAVAVLRRIPIDAAAEALSSPEPVSAMAVLLQRASAEARLDALAILRGMTAVAADWGFVARDQRLGSDLIKTLIELASDEAGTSASPAAIEVLAEILRRTKKARPRAVEAGAVRVVVELLPELGRARAERALALLKLLCGCAEGRLALAEHGMGIAAVTSKAVGVSRAATKEAVKILWLLCSYHPAERVLEEMVACGTVKKLLALLRMDDVDARSSTKGKLVNIFKLHGGLWKRSPCFPSGFKDLGFVHDYSNS